jgi:hypothetical protein
MIFTQTFDSEVMAKHQLRGILLLSPKRSVIPYNQQQHRNLEKDDDHSE